MLLTAGNTPCYLCFDSLVSCPILLPRCFVLRLDYSVVVPVYNNADSLKQLHSRIDTTMASLGGTWELIFIDDGSRDESLAILKHLHKQDEHVKVLEMVRNFGQHPAVSAGFEVAAGEIIITLDADLQNPPEEIPRLVNHLAEGYDLVTGWRTVREDPFMRKMPSLIFNSMLRKMTGSNLNDHGCMLRAYRRNAVEYLKQFPEKGKFIPAVTSWLRLSTCEISVDQVAREGNSSYNFVRLFRMVMDVVTGYTLAPLQVLFPLGAALFAFGLLLGCCLLFTSLGSSNAALTVFAVVTLAGLQLLTVGILGEYIGRIFVQVQKRPYYIVRNVLPSRVELTLESSQEAIVLPSASAAPIEATV